MASIPFRFKAGGDSTASQGVHHHRSTTKNSHKPFKSRHASKNFLRDQAKGKLERPERGARRTPHQQVTSKFDRKNRARQLRAAKQTERAAAEDIFKGPQGAPKTVVVVPLTTNVNIDKAVDRIVSAGGVEPFASGNSVVWVPSFKQKLRFVHAKGSLLEILDACRMADFVCFAFSCGEVPDSQQDGLLWAIKGQGLTTTISVGQDLQMLKKQTKIESAARWRSHLLRFISSGQDKIYSLDNESDCAKVVRHLCSTLPQGIKWRDNRSWMVVEEVDWLEPNGQGSTTMSAVLTGVVRGRNLRANRLVQVGDWGSFTIEKITSVPIFKNRSRLDTGMDVDNSEATECVLDENHEDQEELLELAPLNMEEPAMTVDAAVSVRRGVLLDDHHYFSEDEGDDKIPAVPRSLPEGTSSYQAAWFLDDVSESESDGDFSLGTEDNPHSTAPAMPEDGLEGLDQIMRNVALDDRKPESFASEGFRDQPPDEEMTQLIEYRAQKKTAGEDDMEYPDEIELEPNAMARERLARYRGLKSLKTSHWQTKEDETYQPKHWNRLLNETTLRKAKKQAVKDVHFGRIAAGTRVRVYLRDVPERLREASLINTSLGMYSLLRHEQKRSVVHVQITLPSDHSGPVKSKSELIVQIGPRRFRIKPIFSDVASKVNNIGKFFRFLHPGQSAIASFIAPVTWDPVPALFFQLPASNHNELSLIAEGTNLAPSASRITAKRVILTGHPYKIHANLVTIRYMFFNAEDVKWFKALPLWTKRGRTGFIKESLGTHGYFKATFSGPINPQDAIGVSLYKRVWPRYAKALTPFE